MFSFGYLNWLAGQAFSAAMMTWQVSVPLLAALAAVSIWHFAFRRQRLTRRYLDFLLPFLPMILVLALGTIMNYDHRESIPWLYRISLPLVNILSLIQLLMNVLLVFLNRGFRLISAGVGLIQAWTGFWISAVAGMSISGVWL